VAKAAAAKGAGKGKGLGGARGDLKRDGTEAADIDWWQTSIGGPRSGRGAREG